MKWLAAAVALLAVAVVIGAVVVARAAHDERPCQGMYCDNDGGLYNR